MKQYLEVMRDVRENGEWKENRTGIRTLMIDGAMARYDLRKGFAAGTTKLLAWKPVVGELCGFLRGFTNAADFRAFGCKIWDQNANENQTWLANAFRKGQDDLGVVYGSQWRKWQGFKMLAGDDVDDQAIINHLANNSWDCVGNRVGFDVTISHTFWHKEIDQIRNCITMIIKDPDNRRNLFHAWNPAVMDEIALPACHLLYQFLPNKETKEMTLCMYQRSNDFFLGDFFNIASASLLLSIICHLTGYKPKNFVHFMADVHLYENHLDQVDEQLSREPLPLSTLKISGLKSYDEIIEDNIPNGTSFQDALIDAIMYEIDNIKPEYFTLENYQHHPAIKAPMAV